MTARRAKAQSKQSEDLFDKAMSAYEVAMKLFVEARDWSKAREAFESWNTEFGERRDLAEIAERCRMHARTCEERLAEGPGEPVDGEGWLLRGVICANRGECDEAIEALDRALELGGDRGRIHYAKAAALAVAERLEEALESLRSAIEADATNRAFALGDPDFERLRETAGFAALVDPPSMDSEGGTRDSSNLDAGSDIPRF